MKKYDIPYNDREFSWLDFNFRVLDESLNKSNPIMERLKFLSITSSNLDEFFMVRVPRVIYKSKNTDSIQISGLTSSEKLYKLYEKLDVFVKSQYNCLKSSILPDLKEYGMQFISISELNKEQKNYINDYFERIILPSLTPFIIDDIKSMSLLPGKSINIVSIITSKNNKNKIAIIPLPKSLKRYLELPSNDNIRKYIMVEEIIMNRILSIFYNYKIKSSCVFRITRNANFDVINDDEDYLSSIAKSVSKRKKSEPVRLEISEKNSKEIRDILVQILGINKNLIYKIPGFIDLTFLSNFIKQKGFEDYFFKPIIPINPPIDFNSNNDIFESIQEGDKLIYHPFESFDIVLKFIRDAANDDKVISIKQTLYRVSENSPIINSLIDACKRGKKVTVLVELKARFDEENNILWAKKLKNAGCKVIYGPKKLKTHCKVIAVSRLENGHLRNYVHMGTGNYNDLTAKLYTDIGMFTADKDFGDDAMELFEELAGNETNYKYKKMILAPKTLRKFFINAINNEIENAKNGLKSGITAKMNSLVDPKIISKLYDASKAGVKIELIVRGICCLIPGIEGISENITVTSIVGQLLEHSRIFKFENAGNPKIYLGSSDWMKRNLDGRVELVFPVENKNLKERISYILGIILKDTVNAKIQLSNTEYIKKDGKQIINSQREISNMFNANKY